MVSADILDKTTIKVLGDLGGSDHKPTLITYAKLCGKAKPMRKKLWNFKKANWKKYQNLTDDALEKIQKDNQPINIEYKNICKAILMEQGNIYQEDLGKSTNLFGTKS